MFSVDAACFPLTLRACPLTSRACPLTQFPEHRECAALHGGRAPQHTVPRQHPRVESNTRNQLFSTLCTRNVVSCT
eukprot:3230461-Rhodomonas_salina.1